MKKIAFLILLATIIGGSVFLYQYQAKVIRDRDEAFRSRLAGVWWRMDDSIPPKPGMALSMWCTNTVAADGSFVESSWFQHPGRTNTYQRTGTWTVKSGHLIQTIKSSSNPTETTPWTSTGRIIQTDTNSFTIRWKIDETWQRVVP